MSPPRNRAATLGAAMLVAATLAAADDAGEVTTPAVETADAAVRLRPDGAELARAPHAPLPGAAGSNAWYFAGGEIVSSPKPIDIAGDRRPGIVFGTSLGDVHVVDADGAVLAGWPVNAGTAAGYCSAAVADIDGDLSPDVVIHANGSLVVYAQDGTTLPGWPQALDSNVSGNSQIGSPSVADIDGDGDLEIMVGHFQRMYAFHHDGTLVSGWPVLQAHGFGPLFATPAVADLDGDGDAEICFKIYGGNGDPADIHLLHHDGTPVAGWPKLGLDRSHLSSPVLADVDGDGALDVIVSLHFFNAGNFVRLYAWRLDGTDVPGFPVDGSFNTAPANNAVGDVDGDGSLEIFVATTHYTSPFYAVHAWNHDGTPLEGAWPRSAPLCGLDGSPALADLDGGLNEVTIGVGSCYVDDPGAVNVWAVDGTPVAGWPVFVADFLRSSALVMDADRDATPEIYIGSSDGWIYRFLGADTTGGTPPEWNQIFHDPRNTNCYLPPAATGDLDGDGVVGIADLLILLAAWGPCPPSPTCPGDLDGDGVVGITDLLILLGGWG